MNSMTFPREVCNPRRHIVKNLEEFMQFVNANISTSNLFTNVYNFTEFTPPFMYPIYESAIIDRIYLDCDQKMREGDTYITLPAYENMLKVHEWCVKHDILHFPRCTGTAYDVVVATNPEYKPRNKKECVANAQMWLSKELNVTVDPQVIGDIARIHRIGHTYNHKDTAKRFVIPLDDGIIYTGEKSIFEAAKKQRFIEGHYGTKFWDISEFDTNKRLYTDLMPKLEIDIDESSFADLSEIIPDCIKRLLSIPDLGYKERRDVILVLRDNCYILDETIAILKKHLSPVKFFHCIRDEKQPYYLYQHEKYMFPNQEELIELGACPHKRGKYCDKAKHGCLLYNRTPK